MCCSGYSRPYYLIQRTTSAFGETKQIRIMLRKCDWLIHLIIPR
jgi:hypothetical protein